MATLLFSALGSALGGPIGAALGGLAGGLVDNALIGGSTREGARLGQLAVSTSSYGDALPRHFGTMRVPGTLIWATDLIERSETSGGGKGKPQVRTYSYSCSFAVALASRPILRLGRIWADGNLLRGADGVLKTGGNLRVHHGHGDQPADPLIAAAEGIGRCPAWRGIAYVVFEDLQLADFGNRIPALTFEVVADEGALSLADLFSGLADGIEAGVTLDGVRGITLDGAPAALVGVLAPVFPIDCDGAGEVLRLSSAAATGALPMLGEAVIPAGQGDFGGRAGFVRQRGVVDQAPVRLLRYYDRDRDFQPGLQRAGGRPLPGQPRAVELPAAMTAGDAQRLIARAARAGDWSRETLQWRTAELDPAVVPGAVVAVPGQPGAWRVRAWEWREAGVEIALERVAPGLQGSAGGAVDGGRASVAVDLASGPTELVAFELPWDGSGSGDSPAILAAVSSSGPGWVGAELGVDRGDGAIAPLGASGRTRAIIGRAGAALPAASPHGLDRNGNLVVVLAGADMALRDATLRELALGANRALVGDELVQFARAMRLDDGRWRLSGLLRGRGGTEQRIRGHVAGERFVLLDGALTWLDPALVGTAPEAVITALGLADPAVVASPIVNRGLTLRPLSPVHARRTELPDGGFELRWTRRARGAWGWPDAVEAPLNEQVEAYDVTCEGDGTVWARWAVSEPRLALTATRRAALRDAAPGVRLLVRQRGTHALSQPLFIEI